MNHIIQYELIVNNDVLEKAIPVYDNMYQTVDGTWKEWNGDFDEAFAEAADEFKVSLQSYKEWLEKTGGEGGNLESWLDAGTLDVDMVEVPDGVKIIGAYAFEKCDELRRVILPDSVCEIEEYAFSECTSLEEIRLPEKMDYIGECAFFGCSALRQIKLPYGLTRLEKMVFAACEKLEQVEVPEETVCRKEGSKVE